MSKFWFSILKWIDNSVESISVINNGGNPQIVIQPKGTAKKILTVIKEHGKEKEKQENDE